MKQIISIILILSFMSTLNATNNYSGVLKEDILKEDEIVVLSQMELLAGILTQTTVMWDSTVPSNAYDNDYYIELKNFFEPYKNHKAIYLANQLIKENRFTYNAIPSFATELTELPYLKIANGYSSEIKNRIGDLRRLEAFRLAMIDLANKSKFKEKFYDKHKDFYQEYKTIVKASLSMPIKKTVEDIFGEKKYNSSIVLACGLKSSGAYSTTKTDCNGTVIVYSILAPSLQTGHLRFAIDDALLMHEFAHSYVNPLTEKYTKEVRDLNIKELYEPVKNDLAKQAYVGVDSFINESILYGFMAYIRKKEEDTLYSKFVEDKEKNGFYLTSFIVTQFEDYEKNREIYPEFDEFYPILLQRMSEINP